MAAGIIVMLLSILIFGTLSALGVSIYFWLELLGAVTGLALFCWGIVSYTKPKVAMPY